MAPANGFAGADDYYARCAAQDFMREIRVPTLVIHARNDPWILPGAYLSFDWKANPRLTPLLPRGGGHVGFHGLGSPVPWHDRCIAEFLAASASRGASVRRADADPGVEHALFAGARKPVGRTGRRAVGHNDRVVQNPEIVGDRQIRRRR